MNDEEDLSVEIDNDDVFDIDQYIEDEESKNWKNQQATPPKIEIIVEKPFSE